MIYTFYFTDEKTGFCVDNEHIYRSLDSGLTWEMQKSDYVPEYFIDIQFVNTSTGWVLGVDGEVLKTENGGSDWNLISNQDLHWCFNDIFFLDADNGWMVGDNQRVYRTHDGGVTWDNLQLDQKQGNLSKVQFFDENFGWIFAHGGEVFYTNDGGKTLEMFEVSNASETGFAFDSKNAWAVGAKSTILKFESDGTTPILIDDITSPALKTIPLQVYTNPLQKQIVFRYMSVPEEITHITIYSASGRKITSLQAKDAFTGMNSLGWDYTEGTGSGIHFYTLKNATENRLGRFILVK